jgi:hypothetical protein
MQKMVHEAHPDLPKILYKYLSPDSALAVLKNNSLRFSKPPFFNDDFDARVTLGIEINKDIVIQLSVEKIWEGAYGPVTFPARNAMGAMVNLVRQIAPKPLLSQVEFFESVRPGIIETLDKIGPGFEQLHAEFHAIIANFKILCLSTNPVSAPMWGNYAENISGAALGFAPSLVRDSFFLTAKPISYVDDVPIALNDEMLSDIISGRSSIGDFYLDEMMIYTKFKDWSYECEWRIVAGLGWDPTNNFEYVNFDPQDLEIVILGMRASDQTKEEVASIVAQKYPNCAIRQLVRDQGRMSYKIV